MKKLKPGNAMLNTDNDHDNDNNKGVFTLTEAETETENDKKIACMGLCGVHTDRDRYSDQCQWVSNPFYRSQSRCRSLSLSV